jgi:hypothetical protein
MPKHDHVTVTPQEPLVPERDAFILELQRLLSCYQLANEDDREIVWSVLNKYVHLII